MPQPVSPPVVVPDYPQPVPIAPPCIGVAPKTDSNVQTGAGLASGEGPASVQLGSSVDLYL